MNENIPEQDLPRRTGRGVSAWISVAGRVFRTYPWTMLSSLVFCVGILMMYAASGTDGFFTVFAMASGWAISLSFLVELLAAKLPWRFSRLLPVTVPLLLGAWGWTAVDALTDGAIAGYALALAATHLAVALVGGREYDRFWEWNARLLRALLASLGIALLVGSVIIALALGAGAILSERAEMGSVLLLVLPFLVTFRFLDLLTQPGAGSAQPPCCCLAKGWRLAFLPTVLTLGALLYMEYLKDLLAGTLPPVWNALSLLILVGIVLWEQLRVAAVAVPKGRERSRALAVLLLPLCGLFVVLIAKNVVPGGMTVPRYFELLLAAWAIFSTAWLALGKGPGAVVASLLLLCLVGAWGPSSVYQVAARARGAHLNALLNACGIVPGQKTSHAFSSKDAWKINADVRELCHSHEGQGLEGWLRGPWKAALRSGDSVRCEAVADSVTMAMGILRDEKGWPAIWSHDADLQWKRLAFDPSAWMRAEGLSEAHADKNLRLVVDSSGRHLVFRLDTLARLMEHPAQWNRLDTALVLKDSADRAELVLQRAHMTLKNGKSWRAYGLQGLLLWSPRASLSE